MFAKLWPHHEAAIASLIPELEQTDEAVALVIAGSLTKGWGRPESDLDGHLLINDDAMAARLKRDDLVFKPVGEHCDWDGGYFDLKCVTWGLLEEAADHAGEAYRASFSNAIVPWTKHNDDQEKLDALIERITAYPEAGHAEKVMQLACHLEGIRWYAGEAEKRGDAYLMLWTTQRAVALASRLVLAHNRVLFPYHKWMLRSVASCQQKPDGFLEAVNAAVKTPSRATVEPVCDLALHWQDWGKPAQWWNPWIRRTEWAWRYGPPALDDA